MFKKGHVEFSENLWCCTSTYIPPMYTRGFAKLLYIEGFTKPLNTRLFAIYLEKNIPRNLLFYCVVDKHVSFKKSSVVSEMNLETGRYLWEAGINVTGCKSFGLEIPL